MYDLSRKPPNCDHGQRQISELQARLRELERIAEAARAVAEESWSTSVSENTHFERLGKMDALRAAIDAAKERKS